MLDWAGQQWLCNLGSVFNLRKSLICQCDKENNKDNASRLSITGLGSTMASSWNSSYLKPTSYIFSVIGCRVVCIIYCLMDINNIVVANFLTISYQMRARNNAMNIHCPSKHTVIASKIQIDSEEKDGE